MNETATWNEGMAGREAEAEPREGWGVLVLLACILIVCLIASTWMIWQGSHSVTRISAQIDSSGGLSVNAGNVRLLDEFDHWLYRAATVTAAGGLALLLTLRKTVGFWRRKWRRRLESVEHEWRKKATFLEGKLADIRKSEEQLERLHTDGQKRAATLESANAQLQDELNKLKRTEKTLSQKQQVLESSKAVLEIHVQARTKELQKLQRRYEHILNSAGEGICGLDVEGKTTFVNPAVAKITGWPIDELIGKTEQEIFQPHGGKETQDLSGDRAGEQLFYRKDGTCFPVEFIRTQIREGEKVAGAVLVFKDITERKRVEETLAQKASELARSNAELEQFAFVASHDLQEPLRKIQAFGDRLKTKCEGVVTPDARDYLERMQNAATRMRQLIDDLLAFSRAIRTTEAFASVDLGVVAKEVLGDLEVRIEKSGARVEIGDLPTIEADPMQMRQLLLNLIGNALKFQPAGGAPLVKIHSRILEGQLPNDTAAAGCHPANGESAPLFGRFCELSIEDNGIGFDEQYSEKIFAVFQRLHGRGEYEGSGVGLAVCRRITDRHHGAIAARSQLGKGSTFLVTLPMQQPKPEKSN